MKHLFLVLCLLSASLAPLHAQKGKQSDGAAQGSALKLYREGNYAEAIKAFRLLVADEEARLGPEARMTLANKCNLGVVLNAAGRFIESEKIQREVLAIQVRVIGPDDPDTLVSRISLANALLSQNKLAEAEQWDRTALEISTRTQGPDNLKTLMNRLNLSDVLNAEGKYALAEKENRALLPLLQRVAGPEHEYTLMCRSNLAENMQGQGHWVQADPENRALLAIYERLPNDRRAVYQSCFNLALCLVGENRVPEALVFAQRAEKGRLELLGEQHADTFKARELREHIEFHLKMPSGSVAAAGGGNPPPVDSITPEKAAAHQGETVVVEGLVSAITPGNKGSHYLNFGGKYPNQVFAAYLPQELGLSDQELKSFDGKSVRITGKVVDYKGTSQIVIDQRSQILLVPAVAASSDATLVGRYMKPGEPGEYLDLRSDNTFTIMQGPQEGASGDCTIQGNKVTLVVPGRPLVLEIVNGVFTGPDDKKWQKAPGQAPAPPPADLPNFIGKPAAFADAQRDASEKLTILKCENNVKQMLIGCTLWAADHSGSYPDELADLFTKKYMGAGKPDMLKVPMGTDEKTAVYLYYGKKHADSMPGAKILILSKWKDAQGRHIIGRRDGSVELAVPKKDDYPAPGVKL